MMSGPARIIMLGSIALAVGIWLPLVMPSSRGGGAMREAPMLLEAASMTAPAYEERPLFDMSRRPSGVPAADVPDPSAGPAAGGPFPDGYELRGLARSMSTTIAVVVERGSGLSSRVATGGEVDGWRLVSAEARSAIFRHEDGREARLDLPKAPLPKPPVAAMPISDTGMADPGMSEPAMADPTMAPPGMADPSMAAPNMAAPGMADPGMAAPNMAAPGMADPGMAAPNMAAPGMAEPIFPPSE